MLALSAGLTTVCAACTGSACLCAFLCKFPGSGCSLWICSFHHHVSLKLSLALETCAWTDGAVAAPMLTVASLCNTRAWTDTADFELCTSSMWWHPRPLACVSPDVAAVQRAWLCSSRLPLLGALLPSAIRPRTRHDALVSECKLCHTCRCLLPKRALFGEPKEKWPSDTVSMVQPSVPSIQKLGNPGRTASHARNVRAVSGMRFEEKQ